MYYVGVDFHQRTSTCHILDSRGNAVKERTIPGPPAAMVEFLRSLDLPLTVCFEASWSYGPIYDLLAAFCRRVVVAHPGRLRLIFNTKRKNDRVDAQKLATLLLLKQVPRIHVPDESVRAWRQLIRFRMRQVAHHTRIKNAIRGLLRSNGVVVPPAHRRLWTDQGRAWLSCYEWPTACAKARAGVLLRQLRQARQEVKILDTQLNDISKDRADIQLLRTIPGVGARVAEAVIAYLDDPRRFVRNNRVGAYAGLVPRQDSSGGINRLGGITKDGPSALRWLLVQAAWQATRRDKTIKAFFDRLAQSSNRKKALVAVAHKLLRAMHAMLTSGQPWNPTPAKQPVA